MIHVGNDWQPLFDIEQEKPYYLELRSFLKNEYRTKTVFPPMNEIFNAFMLTSFSDTRVVIVGQDPYHEKDQAMGLSFSVREGVEEPPSLKNIHQEIITEGVEQGLWSSDLTRWAKQGVLLLNSTLTVVEHQAAAHSGKGWEIFTDNAIRALGKMTSRVCSFSGEVMPEARNRLSRIRRISFWSLRIQVLLALIADSSGIIISGSAMNS